MLLHFPLITHSFIELCCTVEWQPSITAISYEELPEMIYIKLWMSHLRLLVGCLRSFLDSSSGGSICILRIYISLYISNTGAQPSAFPQCSGLVAYAISTISTSGPWYLTHSFPLLYTIAIKSSRQSLGCLLLSSGL